MSKTVAKKSSDRVNHLTSISDFDAKNIVFSDPVSSVLPDSPIVNKRVYISVKNPDGTVGDLILSTERLFSFGVSENKDMNDKTKINGYVLPLCLYNRDGPSKEEKEWVDIFVKITELCKKHILDSKESLEKYDLEPSDLKKLNPLYYKKEKGKIVEGTGPVLYAKLISSKKDGKIRSMFFNKAGEPTDAMSLLGVYSYVRAAVKIESIFISAKISLQVKLYEAEVEPMGASMKPLLRPEPKGLLLTGRPVPQSSHESEGSVPNSPVEASEEKLKERTPVKKSIPKKIAVKRPVNAK